MWTLLPPPPLPSQLPAATHTGHQFELVEGTLVIVAEAAIEYDGAVVQNVEEVPVCGAGDDLWQNTSRQAVSGQPWPCLCSERRGTESQPCHRRTSLDFHFREGLTRGPQWPETREGLDTLLDRCSCHQHTSPPEAHPSLIGCVTWAANPSLYPLSPISLQVQRHRFGQHWETRTGASAKAYASPCGLSVGMLPSGGYAQPSGHLPRTLTHLR